jgi:hypothetical protein
VRKGRWRLARPLLLSLAAHGLFIALIWRAPSLTSPAPLAGDLLEIDVRLLEPPAEHLPPAPPVAPAPPPAAPPDEGRAAAPAPESPRARPRPDRRKTGERQPATGAPPPTAAGPPAPEAPKRTKFWLRMRSPVESTPLVQLPPGEQAPTGPPRDELGLPFIPLPDVIHHPIGEQVQGSKRTGTGLQVNVDREGRVAFKDPSGLDVNAMAEQIAGSDPYAFEKRRVAEATFEDRLCLAQEAALRRKQEGLFHLKDRLERLMQLPGLSPAARREMVFEMWDECLDDRPAADDTVPHPDLGAAARASILAFIRRVFPPGSPDAFTPAELATLNQRRLSRSPFAPYNTAPTPDAGAR